MGVGAARAGRHRACRHRVLDASTDHAHEPTVKVQDGGVNCPMGAAHLLPDPISTPAACPSSAAAAAACHCPIHANPFT